jgi:hypothetical protein
MKSKQASGDKAKLWFVGEKHQHDRTYGAIRKIKNYEQSVQRYRAQADCFLQTSPEWVASFALRCQAEFGWKYYQWKSAVVWAEFFEANGNRENPGLWL